MQRDHYKLNAKFIFLFLLFFLQACQINTYNNVYNAASNKQNVKSSYKIYLAGPEVFLPDPIAAGKNKKALIAKLNQENDWPFTLVGLYPMDNEIDNFSPDVATGMKIYHANIKLMQQADYITANMVRFRGPSMDVGTAFEMGYMRGLEKPVFAYFDARPFYGQTEKPQLYSKSVKQHYFISPIDDEKDIHGQTIENFQMSDNLMMIGSLESGENKISDSFEAAVLSIAKHIQNTIKNSNLEN